MSPKEFKADLVPIDNAFGIERISKWCVFIFDLNFNFTQRPDIIDNNVIQILVPFHLSNLKNYTSQGFDYISFILKAL